MSGKKTTPSKTVLSDAGVFGVVPIGRRNEFYYPRNSLTRVRDIAHPVIQASAKVVKLLQSIG
jgi:hypothetical protein